MYCAVCVLWSYGENVYMVYLFSFAAGFFYANEFNMVQQNFTGTPSPGWDVAGIAVFPDTTVFISSRLYDYATGASLIDTEVVVCQLGNGVTFFRYP
jgi:hypothetical protein